MTLLFYVTTNIALKNIYVLYRKFTHNGGTKFFNSVKQSRSDPTEMNNCNTFVSWNHRKQKPPD